MYRKAHLCSPIIRAAMSAHSVTSVKNWEQRIQDLYLKDSHWKPFHYKTHSFCFFQLQQGNFVTMLCFIQVSPYQRGLRGMSYMALQNDFKTLLATGQVLLWPCNLRILILSAHRQKHFLLGTHLTEDPHIKRIHRSRMTLFKRTAKLGQQKMISIS